MVTPCGTQLDFKGNTNKPDREGVTKIKALWHWKKLVLALEAGLSHIATADTNNLYGSGVTVPLWCQRGNKKSSKGGQTHGHHTQEEMNGSGWQLSSDWNKWAF